jgi:Tol biopolymer transport system component/imidazolonepropionase-like amidohydrolase
MRLASSAHSLLVGLCFVLTPSRAIAQSQPAGTSWDVTQPRGRATEIDFPTTEGTWISIDVSPDGTWIVFDLLGHIYRMPIAGGAAECLTQSSGIAINVQPRISPDGKSIAFISDRKGQMNVWVMDSDGKNPVPVLLDTKYEYRWPGWSADGRFVVAVKRPPFTVTGFNSLMMLSRGGGNGIELLKGENGRNPYRASISADGRFAYYDVYTSAPNVGRGRQDALRGSIQLHRLDLETGTVQPITAGETEQGNADHPSSGGAYAAEPSPDGRFLSFMRKVPGGTLNYKGQRYGPRSALWIRDLVSGAERLAMDPVEMDLSEASFPLDGTYPSYKWMPDSKGIVIHQGGKIRRLDLTNGAVSTIPFSARVHRTISEQPWIKNRLSDGPVDIRFVRWASSAPDGKTLAFQAVGRVWLMDRPNGPIRRLTPESFAPHEFQPAWSPDGQSIAFTTWQDEQRGALWVTSARGGAPRRLTRDPGEFANPAWTPDGRELVVARGAGATARGQTMLRNPYFDLVRIPIEGGDAHFVVQIGRSVEPYARRGELVRPTVGTNGRIYFFEVKPIAAQEGGRAQSSTDVVSIRPDGSDRIIHARIGNAGDVAVAPNGQWVTFAQGMNLYLAPLPASGSAAAVPTIDRRGGDLSTTALSTEGGIHPRWRSNDVVEFVSGNRIFAYNASTGRGDTITVRLSAPRDLAQGSIALTGARIIPLNRQQVIENGTVVIRAGRIACVGQCSTSGADRVISALGRTIIPGFVDVHAHHDHGQLGMMPTHNFESSVYLAYGVTTTFDPSPTSIDPFASGQLVEAGLMVGPRIFTSGETLTNGDDITTRDVTSLDVALNEVGRRKSWGAPMLKQYLQPTRYQRQWVVEAARQLNIRTTAEGSADLYHKLSMVMDGHTGGEHLTVQAPLYGDVLNFMAKARYVYSHTPLVSGASAWNEEYFWQEATPLWQDPKLQRWIPWRELIPHTRRFVMRPETDYMKDIVAQTAADLLALGGYSAIGSHGQQHGLGSHWDVWMLAKAAGAMSALEVASMHGATFLGMDEDLGSISVGKLGDLMVLNGNPLTNIRNTANIQYVMKAGVLYDANSLDEIWPKSIPYGNYYWVLPEMYRIDEKRVDVPR